MLGLADAGGAATWQLEELYHGELQRRKELALGIALNDMLSALGLETSGECVSELIATRAEPPRAYCHGSFVTPMSEHIGSGVEMPAAPASRCQCVR